MGIIYTGRNMTIREYLTVNKEWAIDTYRFTPRELAARNGISRQRAGKLLKKAKYIMNEDPSNPMYRLSRMTYNILQQRGIKNMHQLIIMHNRYKPFSYKKFYKGIGDYGNSEIENLIAEYNQQQNIKICEPMQRLAAHAQTGGSDWGVR